jgi:hypothetical protein
LRECKKNKPRLTIQSYQQKHECHEKIGLRRSRHFNRNKACKTPQLKEKNVIDIRLLTSCVPGLQIQIEALENLVRMEVLKFRSIILVQLASSGSTSLTMALSLAMQMELKYNHGNGWVDGKERG